MGQSVSRRPNDTRAHWTRWAILIALFERPRRAKDIYWWLHDNGWAVLSQNGQMDQIHRALKYLSEGAPPMAIRHTGRPAMYELTDFGREWARDCLVDNPHITPEKSQERFA